MPMDNIFGRRSSLPTVSKAALRSNPTTATIFPFALAETQAAWAMVSAVVHDLPFLKPCCDVGRMSFSLHEGLKVLLGHCLEHLGQGAQDGHRPVQGGVAPRLSFPLDRVD
jgi:hypothetical protein